MRYSAIVTLLLAAVVAASPIAEAEPAITAAPELHEVREAFMENAAASCPAKVCVKSAKAVATCATSCIISAASRAGCKTSTDFSCQCAKSSTIASYAQNCVISNCGLSTAIEVQSEVASVCKCNKNHHYTSCK